MLFPLDPYLLRRSAKLLDLPTSYLRWQQRLQPPLAVGETAVDEAAGEPGHGQGLPGRHPCQTSCCFIVNYVSAGRQLLIRCVLCCLQGLLVGLTVRPAVAVT